MSPSTYSAPPKGGANFAPDYKELFHLLADSVPEGAVFALDQNGSVVQWSQSAERLFQYPAEEILGAPFEALCAQRAGTPRERLECVLERAAAEGRAQAERMYANKQGAGFWCNEVLIALKNPQGELYGYLNALNAMTKDRQRLKEMQARLKYTKAEMHHRMKNTLQMVSALTDLQTQSESNAEIAGKFERISLYMRSVAAIHELLRENAEPRDDAATISVSRLVEKLSPLLQGIAGERTIRFIIDDLTLPESAGVSLMVLINELVINALKHGQGAITATLAVEGAYAELKVEDEGEGIPETFTLNPTSYKGLNLVNCIAELDLHGEAKFQPRQTGGAITVVRFPVVPNVA